MSKRILVVLVMMVLVIGSAAAQWQDYEWGMSMSEVDATLDTKYFSQEDGDMTMSQYLVEVFDYTTYATFLFERDKLVAIILESEGYLHRSAKPIFINRYGQPDAVESNRVGWQLPDQVIVSETAPTDMILYSEPSFFDNIYEKMDKLYGGNL